MAYIYGRNDRFYVAKQVAYATIRHTDGAANLAATDACKHNSFTATPNRTRIQPAFKESTTNMVFIDQSRAGRINGSATVSMPIFGGSAAGTQPDLGPILESAFGSATEAAGSVTYARDADAFVPLELWGFNAAGKRGVCAFGSIVNRLTISGGQDTADLSADFISYAVLGQDRFASAITAEKGGLTSWPAEPGSQTYTGSQLTGFTCTITLGGTKFVSVRDWSITMDMARAYDLNHCEVDGTEFFPQTPFAGVPDIRLAFSLWSVDTAAMDTLIGNIVSRTAFDATVVLGATAGGIYTFSLNNLILPTDVSGDGFTHEDGDDRKVISVPALRAQATNASAVDEIGLVIT